MPTLSHQTYFDRSSSMMLKSFGVILLFLHHFDVFGGLGICVDIFTFMAGVGCWYRRDRTIKSEATRLLKCLLQWWLVLFILCIPAALYRNPELLTAHEIYGAMFGKCYKFNCIMWYLHFYICAMILMKIYSLIAKKYPISSTIILCLICIWGHWGNPTALMPNLSPTYQWLLNRYSELTLLLLLGYWFARTDLLEKLSSPKGISRAIIGCAILIISFISHYVWQIPYAGYLLVTAGIMSGCALIISAPISHKIRQPLIFLGTNSMFLWSIHGIFISKSTNWLYGGGNRSALPNAALTLPCRPADKLRHCLLNGQNI